MRSWKPLKYPKKASLCNLTQKSENYKSKMLKFTVQGELFG